MDKIEHQRKKLKYYRNKNHPDYAEHYEAKYKNWASDVWGSNFYFDSDFGFD